MNFFLCPCDLNLGYIYSFSFFWYWFWLVAGGGARLEQELLSEINFLRQRISQVEMINAARRRDLALLTQHVNRSLPYSSESIIDDQYQINNLLINLFDRLFDTDLSRADGLPELSRLLLEPNQSQNLRLPNIFSFLPYLLNDPLSTVPAFVIGQGKSHGTLYNPLLLAVIDFPTLIVFFSLL